ncbi:MAG: hypothetical protein ACF8XB_24160, partial [Planctomycetota bacterium JB042]
PHDLADLSSGAAPDLAARAVVVSASAHGRVDPAALRAFAEGGGVVLIDGPRSAAPLREGLLALAGARDGGGRGAFPADLVPPGLDDADVADWRGAPVPLPDGGRLLLPADVGTVDLGHGLFLARRVGRGRVVVAAVDVARWLTTMLQGAPTRDDFTLEERHGDYEGILEPDDLVADPRLRTNEVPFADLLARAVVRLLDPPDAPPLPRALWFPAASQGVVLMTHDEDFQGGDATEEMHRWDERLGVKGTSFVIPHPRMEEDWTSDSLRLSLGLHWNRYPMPHGVGPVEPVAWTESCAEQMGRLKFARLLPTSGWSIGSNRNHYLIVGPTWTSTFRTLAGAGITIDSTFGANKGRGHLFGTARPYAILDENGFPLPLRELPFVNQEDWGGADARYFSRMFETNAARHKGALVLLFHPHLIVRTPAGAALFEHAARESLRTGHRPMTMDAFDSFWSRRTGSTVRSEVVADRLRVTVRPRTSYEGAVGFEIAVPETWGRVASVSRGGGVPRPVVRRTIGGISHAVVEAGAGDGEFEFRFERE